MTNEYDSYVRAEWTMFTGDEARQRESLNAVAGLKIDRVLDVGCGAGQELLPFASELGALCVGVDVAPEVGLAGKELFASRAPTGRVFFARTAAERLPFSTGTFDVAICRLALPYTNNRQCFSELARVLRPGGALLLKIHHARYYLRKLKDGLLTGNIPSAIHAGRVLTAGCLYWLTGNQPQTRVPSRETFQTLPMLRRELDRYGLEIARDLRDSNPLTPSFLIVKADS